MREPQDSTFDGGAARHHNMPELNLLALNRLHASFERRMLKGSDGQPFVSFAHPFFVKDEVEYKQRVQILANEALKYGRWKRREIGSGAIRKALRAACGSAVSANLLEHRFGDRNGPARALYGVKRGGLADFETQFYDFFRGGDSTPAQFGPRFDALASFLRENRLGCSWPFMAYLAFVYAPDRYFPILPEAFDLLLNELGLSLNIVGNVSWQKYKEILDVADELRGTLARYGRASPIEIQSYIWVLSCIVREPQRSRDLSSPEPNLEDELARRLKAAEEKERIGLAGEKLILELERSRLRNIGRRDLSRRTRLVSVDNTSCGYDVLSFNRDGSERHVEVKTTVQARSTDRGFFLTAGEYESAQNDSNWTVARVWSIDGTPEHKFLGNIIAEPRGAWSILTAAWFVARIAEDDV